MPSSGIVIRFIKHLLFGLEASARFHKRTFYDESHKCLKMSLQRIFIVSVSTAFTFMFFAMKQQARTGIFRVTFLFSTDQTEEDEETLEIFHTFPSFFQKMVTLIDNGYSKMERR